MSNCDLQIYRLDLLAALRREWVLIREHQERITELYNALEAINEQLKQEEAA